MNAVYADTGYWIAIYSVRDNLHRLAIDVTKQLGDRMIVTSEMVFTEFLNAFSAGGVYQRTGAARMIAGLYARSDVVVMKQSANLFADAFRLYSARPDKGWSLTDCASMTICQQEAIEDVLAYDHHFEQAGFRLLLREPE